jgi:large subunit ribosomal protein L21
MYAIVDIRSKQFKVSEGDTLYVPYQKELEVGDEVTYGDVMLLSEDGQIEIGQPVIDGAAVTAEVLDHVKGDKKIVFKFKRRNRYRVKRGHRQPYTQIEITGITAENSETTEEEAEAAPEAA